MYNTFTRLSQLMLLLVLATSISAQDSTNTTTYLWPADADDNGRVNGVDLLLWSYAAGKKGDARPAASTEWIAQPMAAAWSDTFPDGNSLSYADFDGDGTVAVRDFDVATTHFGRIRPGMEGGTFVDAYDPPVTGSDYSATLTLRSAGRQLTAEGMVVLIDVVLTGRDSAVADFHGLSFEASFPAAALSETRISGFTDDDQTSADRMFRDVVVDNANARLAVMVTKLGDGSEGVDGTLLRLRLPLPDAGSDINWDAAFTVDQLVVYDKNLDKQLTRVMQNPVSTTECAFSVNPVCGSDGVTYLNSCFAEAAGVTQYTAGACWNPGIVVTNMNPDAVCGSYYEPVCGFNGVTYPNACTAEAAGVIDYFTGVCEMGTPDCYDPALILISNGTELNRTTGVITLDCEQSSAPVCGCDGQQYANACVAEAAGIRNYTTGACDSLCVNPAEITGTDACGTEQAFVCGCNDETYINACYAEAAGVQNYTPGPCNGTSTWCNEATVISCGDYLPNETTIGAGNQISSYPGGTSVSMLGQDRVYVFEKTSAGDIQVGLEITTPGLNMDLFLLRGDCGNYTCVGASTYSNSATNNEGIVLNDAPNGTYYIVVDQATAGAGGDYRLELSCGYLDCSQRVPLTCGTTYNGTNAGGTDDVSTYTCGPQLNVENNGPEVVHSFTTTETGLVDIALTGLTANLELFLLSECSRRSCLQFSQNSGTADETISRNLPAGTYYVVVDGYNGAVSDYNLRVDCAASCNMTGAVTAQTPTGCGQTNGSIGFQVSGGSPMYSAHYVGPVCRSALSSNGYFYFTDLPAGDYQVIFADVKGCELTLPFTIGASAGSIQAIVKPIDAGCGEEGRVDVDMVTVGTPPYTITMSGKLNRTFQTNSNKFVITPLEVGSYTMRITDVNGCSTTESFSIRQTAGNMDVTAWGEDAGCSGGNTGQIIVRAPNGTLPYRLQLSGPVNGGQYVNGYNFRIRTLPAGTYHLTLTDATGCSHTQTVVINAGSIEATVSATPANCTQPGAARVNIATGTPPYTINYTGPVSGTRNTSEAITVINDLPAGSYNFSIWSADGCDVSRTIRVEDGGGDLGLTVSQMTAACDGNDSELQVIVNGGTGPYTVTYNGPTQGSFNVDGTGTGNINLPPGTYTFAVRDFGNCSATSEVTINGGLTSGGLSSLPFGSGCGQLNSIQNFLGGGELPFQITMTSADCPEQDTTFTAFAYRFDILNLPNCTYRIEAVDANGCRSASEVRIDVDPDADFLILEALDGACGGSGSVYLTINAGEHPYFIDWTGPQNGSINLVGNQARIDDLPAGTYTFSLSNRDGCTANETITLLNDGSQEIIPTLVSDDCGATDQIWVDIEGGTAPYDIEVKRLCDNVIVDPVLSGVNGFEIVDLLPCCYEITVTDANGCTSKREVCVPPYQLFNPIVTDGLCGQLGAIEVMVMNAATTGPYTVSYEGPLVGIFSSPDGQATLQNMPVGTYTITVTDANGCSETETVVVEDVPSDLDLQTAVISNNCGQYNQLWNDITGGQAPYEIEVTRLCDNTIDTTFIVTGIEFELFELDDCCYRVKVTDAQGCMVTTESCITGSAPEIFTPTPVSGPCGQNGRIDLSFTRGQAPYMVVYTGPQSGDNTVNGNQLSVNDIPPGNYTFTVTDANGCSETETVTLEETTNDLVLQAALVYNDCNQYNQIWIDIFNGTGPFNIEVIRLCDGTTMTEFVTGEVGFELEDLTPCDYKIIVTDAAGCMVMDVITVFPAPIDLFDFTAASGECGQPSLFDLQGTRGRAPFTLVLDGPVRDSVVLQTLDYRRDDLPSGSYLVSVSDSLGCIESGQFTLNNTDSDLDLVTSLIFNDCGQLNQLWSDINGGVGPFDVLVTRRCDNSIDTTFTTSLREFELFNKDRCDYEITVTDANGCSDVDVIGVSATTANLFELEADNRCDSTGFRLHFIAGEAPYRVMIGGPTVVMLENVTEDIFVPALPGDYSIRATSAQGCMEMGFASLTGDGAGDPPTVDFSPTADALAVTFTNNSAIGTYAWDFGDGNNSTDTNPVHTYAAAGTYRVCLTATNGCGPTTGCQEVTVSTGNGAQIVIGSGRSFAGGAVQVPVSLQGVDNVASLSGTFALADPSLATVTSITGAAITPQYNADNGSFSFVANDNAGVNLPNADANVLFYLNVRLGNAFGSSTITMPSAPLKLEMSSVQNGIPLLVDVGFRAGNVEVAANVLGNISSQAMTMGGGRVADVTFQLTEPDGGYVFELPENSQGLATTLSGLSMGRTYLIEPIKRTNYRNGLSSFEAFLTQRYLLGYDVPQITDPMQVVAMDMNCSQRISTTDIFIMRRLLLEDNLDEIPGCNSWSFVPTTHEFPLDWSGQRVFPAPRRAEVMLESDTMVMFRAVKTGDLLLDADPGRSNLAELKLSAQLPQALKAGRNYRLQLRLDEAADLVALQGEIALTDGLDLVSYRPLLDGIEMAAAPRNERAFRLSWISTTGAAAALNAGAALVEIAVRATRNLTVDAATVGFTDTDAFRALAHDGSYTAHLPSITLRAEADLPASFQLLGASPNPASDFVDIRFTLPRTSATEMVLMDALGRPVASRRQRLEGGTQRFRLDTRSLPAGAYHYQLRAEDEVVSGKLVIRR